MANTYTTDRVITFAGTGSSGSVPVYLNPSSTILQPDVKLAVAANTVTTVTTFTNTSTDVVFIDGWVGSGQYDGTWQLVIDTSFKDERQSTGSQLHVGVQYATPLRLAPGSTVDVKVEHYGTGTGQFTATIFGHRQ